MDGAQEVARFRALMMVVGVEVKVINLPMPSSAMLAGALKLGGVFHGAHAGDGAPGRAFQPRHRMHGADGSGIGRRNVTPGKVFSGQLAVRARRTMSFSAGCDRTARIAWSRSTA